LGSHLSTLSTAERDAAQIAALVGACRPIELPAALFFFDQPDRVADPAYNEAMAALFAELAAGGAGVGVASAQGRAFSLRTESSL
jgi:ABC-type cobalamin transport system ATPase subunit